MDGRLMAGAAVAVAASVLGGFAMVHARAAGERAREAERRIDELSARLQKLEDAAPALPAGPLAGSNGAAVGHSEPDRVNPSSKATGPGASAPGERSEPGGPALSGRGDPGRTWAALPPEDRRAMLELVREAQKELRQQEIWGWATGIQASFTKSLREKLQLTAVQEDRVAAVLKVHLPEMNKVWHSPDGTPEEQAAKSAELWAKVDAEIAPLLTGEQALQYDAWRKEQAEKAKKHAEGGGR